MLRTLRETVGADTACRRWMCSFGGSKKNFLSPCNRDWLEIAQEESHLAR